MELQLPENSHFAPWKNRPSCPQKRCSASSNWFDFQGKTGMLGLGSVFWIHHLVTWFQIYSKLCYHMMSVYNRCDFYGFDDSYEPQAMTNPQGIKMKLEWHPLLTRHYDCAMASLLILPPEILTWHGKRKNTMFHRRYIFSIVILVFRGALCCWLYWI